MAKSKKKKSTRLTTRERECRKVVRVKAMRKVARNFLVKFFSVMMILSLCFGVAYNFWLKDSPSFRVVSGWFQNKIDNAQLAMGLELKDIVLVGRDKAALADIKEAVGIKVGDPLFSLSLEESKARLEKVSWVKEARLHRKFPGTLMIEIQERKPVAMWQNKGQLKLIDADGVVISTDEVTEYSDLPIVIGEKAPEKIYGLFKMLSAQENLFKQVSSITYVGERRWDVKFYNGVQVKLPEDNPNAAWNYLAELENDKKILERDIISLDFRLKDRVFIGLRDNHEDIIAPKKAGEAT